MAYDIDQLMPGARSFVDALTDVKPGEEVVIITDKNISIKVSQAVAAATVERKGKPVIIVTEPPEVSAGEPPKAVAAAMRAADVIFGFLSKSLAHTESRREACKAGARMISFTGITEENLIRGPIKADFYKLWPLVQKLQDKMSQGKRLRLSTPSGTDITADIEGRRSNAEMWSRERGVYSGAPNTEVNVSPIEGTTSGVIVVDGTVAAGIGVVREPIRLTVEAGRVTNIEGGKEARKLEDALSQSNSCNAYVIAEVSMGMNPEGRVSDNIAESEATYGTCHIALGNNISLGGCNAAPVHIDMVLWRPTLEIDGEVLFRDGKQLFDPLVAL